MIEPLFKLGEKTLTFLFAFSHDIANYNILLFMHN